MNPISKEFITGLSQLEMIEPDGSSNGLIHVSDLQTHKVDFIQRLALEKAKKVGADAIYFRNFSDSTRASKAQLYIFDFTDNEKNIVEIHKNVWSSSEVRLYLVINKTEVKFFNSSKPVNQNKKTGILSVDPFETIKIAGEASEKFKKYSAKKFDNGTFWENSSIDFGYSETSYEKLISELKNARNLFLKEISLEKAIASKLLVLGILVKYLEERVDIDENGKETRVFTTDFFNQKKFGYSINFTDTIRKGNGFVLNLFDYLSEHFNGKIFYLSDDYKNRIKDINLSPLANFLSGNIDNNQFVFWKLYSFNHLPIELISSIYEMFLEADKGSGVAYTPSYLVNFMVDECMPINTPKQNIKILDPACGSGIFLVAAYKRIIDWWRIEIYQECGKWITPGKDHLDELKRLLKESIFGIDIESEAVDLSIFSLSLTLCDILSPKVIWDNLRFDDLSNNVVDSDFFDWFIKNKSEKFDLIIGNPPFIEYGSKELKINNLTTTLNLKDKVPNNQSSLLFTILSMKLVKKEVGLLAFILPSGPLLYNNSQKPINFRKWLIEKYNIPQIIDFTYLSTVLFKNKGNEKNVAVSAFFLENKAPDNNPIYHITVKKLKSAKERQYFEIDHYDFHKVTKNEASNNPFVWKTNLLGGGRLTHLINKLNSFQTFREFLDKRKQKGWIYGDGMKEGKKDDHEVTLIDLEKKTYREADFLTGKEMFDPSDFDEHGIHHTYICTKKFFERSRNTKKEIFKGVHLLIKKNLGIKSIPCILLDKDIIFKNEVIGIHAPHDSINELKSIFLRINKNSLYRFYILTTSARSGVSRSTKTTLQKDIMNLPFPENEKDIELTNFDEILINDTLEYGLEFLGKDSNIKSLKPSTNKELNDFGIIYCSILNSLFQTESKQYSLTQIHHTDSFICTIFKYGDRENIALEFKTTEDLEKYIAELVFNKLGSNYRINRVVRLYDGDYIYLLKPKELRYWLKSVAIKDADETIVDLYKAGY